MKTMLTLSVTLITLIAFSYYELHGIVAQRIAVLNGSNRMPPEDIYRINHFPPDSFDNVIRNVGVAIGQRYFLRRDFYSPQILDQFFAAGSNAANLQQNGQDVSVGLTRIDGIVPDALSKYGPRTLTFEGGYHQSIFGRSSCWGRFLLPEDNPIKFTDLVGTLGYQFITPKSVWVHDGPPPVTGPYGNQTIVYDRSRELYKATIAAGFYPNGSLAWLSFNDESK